MAHNGTKLPKPVKYQIETLNSDGTVMVSHYEGNDKADADLAFANNPISQAFHKVKAAGFHRKKAK